MTMADRIAVMHEGRIEQVGAPDELYERPRTAFVAGFLGVSNLLLGSTETDGVVRLDAGGEVRVAPSALAGRGGTVAVGIRPEKVQLGRDEENVLEGVVAERSYVGVATQYIVETAAGAITVYSQNTQPGAQPASEGDRVAIAWSPDATFVVDGPEEVSQ